MRTSNSLTCSACNGCKHQNESSDGWCYMFNNRPEDLPCGQHDKYEAQRAVISKLASKYPLYLTALLGMREEHDTKERL